MSRLSRIAAAALAAASLAALTLPATAEEVATSRPLAAASLHEGPLDMVAYFIEGEGDVYEVTATFAPRAAPYAEPMRVVMALRDGVVPPTLNLHNLDPEVDLDVVAGEPRPGNYEYAISNSFGFGGHNVALAFGKY